PAGGCGICYKVNRGGARPTVSLPENAKFPQCFCCSRGIFFWRFQIRSPGVFSDKKFKGKLHFDSCESKTPHTPIFWHPGRSTTNPARTVTSIRGPHVRTMSSSVTK